mgnify:CR=1 FL=1
MSAMLATSLVQAIEPLPFFFFLRIRRPPRATLDRSSAASDVYKRQAIETADIALMTDDLGKIAEAMEISRATLANMRQNLVIAVLTVVGLLFGVYTESIHMAGGMLIHQLSVLIVIGNGMRLLLSLIHI